MTKLIDQMTAREIRARRIEIRRLQNATARSLGFKNFKEWQPDND